MRVREDSAGPGGTAETRRRSAGDALGLAVDSVAGFAVAALVLVPLVDLLMARFLFHGLPASAGYVEHAVLVLALASAASASRSASHLSLSMPARPDGRTDGRLAALASALARLVEAGASAGLFWASLSLLLNGFGPDDRVGFLPTRLLAASMPLGFLLMCGWSILRPAARSARLLAVAGALGGSLLSLSAIAHLATALLPAAGPALAGLEAAGERSLAFLFRAKAPLAVLVGLGAAAGAPIFAVLGGLALVLLGGSGSWLEIAPSEAYALLRGGSIASLPLFALSGFILAESGAGARLVAVFRALFGWLPGGEAAAAVLVSAMFTTFTGASGVTIIALGGLLAGILVDSGRYPPGAARGLVAASGAIGLLLPPSAAIILYAVNAQFIYGDGGGLDISSLFRGALLPGILLVLAMSAAGAIASFRSGARAKPFDPRAVGAALKPAALELLAPLLIALLYFTGTASLVESAAASVAYLALVEGPVKRELGFAGLAKAVRKSVPVLGGTLAILIAARALSFYLIDADVPGIFTAWVQARAHSPLVFLLFLNLALLAVGCVMDIYSAILVAAPLVIPLGAAFGIHPVHLGVIFILNLSLGFLTPPVGMSLFLASYAFDRPLWSVVREVMPYFLLQIGILGLVTYLPWLTTALLAGG